MSALLHLCARLPNYVRRFGVLDGLRLLFSIESGRNSVSPDVIEAVRVPGFTHELSLRRQQGDRAAFWQCIVRRQYDISGFAQTQRLIAEYEALLSEGAEPLVIDGGANIGFATLSMATAFPRAKFIAVEPDADNAAVLERNLRPMGDRAQVLEGALWNESAHLRISNPNAGSSAFRVEVDSDPGSDKIRAYTIDEICVLGGFQSLFIVKLDIEGAQAALFRSGTDWVARAHLIMLELDDWLLPWQGTSRAFFSCLSRYPFDYVISGETIFCFRDFGTSASGRGHARNSQPVPASYEMTQTTP